MVDRLVAVDDADYRLPEPVRDALATDMAETFGTIRARTVSAYEYGVRPDTGVDQASSLHAAFAAAEAAGGGGSVELPWGKVTIDGHFSLDGYSSGMIGAGGSAKSLSVESGTVLSAINQDGPVLDFTGFIYPNAQRGRVTFEGFSVEGDGVVDPANKGIYVGTTGALSSIDFKNITIYNTGGTGLHVKDHYLSEFHSITVCNPVNAGANDTPWVLLEGANGNRWYGLGLRSLNFNDNLADVGPSGALRMITGSTFQHHLSAFYAPWFENLHLGNGSSIVVMQANKIAITDWEFFDCYRTPAATDTSWARIEPPASQNYGANIIRGNIPGKGSAGTNEIELGVDLTQHNNHILGTKGYGGNNVRLASGVEKTFVMLGGGVAPGNNLGIVDNSGMNTNTLIDTLQGSWVLPTGSLRIGGQYQGDNSAVTNAAANFSLTALLGVSVFRVNLQASVTMTALTSNSSQSGRKITVVITQDATGGRTLTWPANVKFAGGSPPTLSAAPGAVDTISFVYHGTFWAETSRSLAIA